MTVARQVFVNIVRDIEGGDDITGIFETLDEALNTLPRTHTYIWTLGKLEFDEVLSK